MKKKDIIDSAKMKIPSFLGDGILYRNQLNS